MKKILLASAFTVFFSAPLQADFLDDLGSALDNVASDIGSVIEGDVNAEDPKSTPSTSPAVEVTEKKFEKLDVEEADLWHEARFQWGQIYNPKSVKYIKADVNCDGHMDYVAHRVNGENPDGPFYSIMVVTRAGGYLSSEGVMLKIGGDEQEAICAMPNADPDVTVSVEHWDEGEIDAAFGSWEGICTEVIKIDDGMCDAPQYFWRTDLSPDDNHPRLMFFRN
jgi:hypothetical protein